jgi:chromosome segregation ATPase
LLTLKLSSERTSANLQDVLQEKEELLTRIDALEKTLKDQASIQSGTSQELTQSKSKLSELSSRQSMLDKEMSSLVEEKSALNNELTALKREIASVETSLRAAERRADRLEQV